MERAIKVRSNRLSIKDCAKRTGSTVAGAAAALTIHTSRGSRGIVTPRGNACVVAPLKLLSIVSAAAASADRKDPPKKRKKKDKPKHHSRVVINSIQVEIWVRRGRNQNVPGNHDRNLLSLNPNKRAAAATCK
jgi:hypothetical protein